MTWVLLGTGLLLAVIVISLRVGQSADYVSCVPLSDQANYPGQVQCADSDGGTWSEQR